MTPPVDLAAVKKLADAATPGPWQECGHERGGCSCGLVWSTAHDVVLLAIRERDEDMPTPDTAHCRANAKFIAESRTLVPVMAEEIEALRAVAEAARRCIGGLPAHGSIELHRRLNGLRKALKNLDANAEQPHRTAAKEGG